MDALLTNYCVSAGGSRRRVRTPPCTSATLATCPAGVTGPGSSVPLSLPRGLPWALLDALNAWAEVGTG